MALAAVRTAMNQEGKSLHPFFSQPSTKDNADQRPQASEASVNDPHHGPDYNQKNTSPRSGQGRQKRTRKADGPNVNKAGASVAKNQSSLESFTRLAEPSLEEDPNQHRRKRRKSASPDVSTGLPTSAQPPPEHLDWHQQLQAEAGRLTGVEKSTMFSVGADTSRGNTSEESAQNNADAVPRPCTPPTTAPAAPKPNVIVISSGPAQDEARKTTPKKQIKVSKNGKLLSSPPKSAPQPSITPKKRRARKPATVKVSPTVTIIKYGSDAASRLAFGQKIEAIFRGKKPPSGRLAIAKTAPSKPAGPPKATHPFFTGKPGHKNDAPTAQAAAEQRPPTPRKSAVTPGKLRAEARRGRSPGPISAFGMSSKTSRVAKQSGQNQASWPTRETAHVRNLDDARIQCTKVQRPSTLALRHRKLKNNVVSLPGDEEVISRLARDLSQDMCRENDSPVSEFEPPQDVRLPTRLLSTGIEIQRMVRHQIQASLSRPGEQQRIHNGTHPAVTTLFNDIEHTLTPFDEGRCESQAWTHKYSPRDASQVLQVGTEAATLKDWLQSLTVMAVGGALKSSSVSDVKKPPRKKRKKVVDDFIVWDEEEEEDEDMIELADVAGIANAQPKSLRLPHWTRNKNLILVSGPHGCGKSATVYAVAKELGFEVFEINSGVRRSGKDIQDKVGDMTANHLVSHKRSASPVKDDTTLASDAENERMDTALREDLDSGRQGTMTSFFQTNGVAKAKLKVRAATQEPTKAPTSATQATLPLAPATRKSQKQSLILFEEADVLFEEDQQFWTQVARLASQSKRPIIVTCNDERQIPIQDLPLAAILRLQPPPLDLATDYLLVLAGREGHILQRQAVSDLYKSKNHDLRASITELNFWCQMSVGDKKGGLEWMYQRWPPGKDVDEHGRLLRVASEGTYQSGMGWLSHNMFETRATTTLDKEEELLKEVWAEWGMSPMELNKPSMGMQESLIPKEPGNEQIGNLARLDAYSDSLSAADIYCRVGLPSYDQTYHEPTDTTQPPIPNKARLSYTLAAPLLQIDHQSDFLNLDCSISTQTHLLIKRAFPDLSLATPRTSSSQPTLSEPEYARAILAHKDAQQKQHPLQRSDFSAALDILAAPPDQTLVERTSYTLTPSSFDRAFSLVTLDLAPYVRSMVAHEQILEAQRIRLSSLLSAGGTGKRPRTTRASRVALEGGLRETKRRDRWFDRDLHFELVMRTAGREWAGLGWKGEAAQGEGGEGTESVAGTQESGEGGRDAEV